MTDWLDAVAELPPNTIRLDEHGATIEYVPLTVAERDRLVAIARVMNCRREPASSMTPTREDVELTAAGLVAVALAGACGPVCEQADPQRYGPNPIDGTAPCITAPVETIKHWCRPCVMAKAVLLLMSLSNRVEMAEKRLAGLRALAARWEADWGDVGLEATIHAAELRRALEGQK